MFYRYWYWVCSTILPTSWKQEYVNHSVFASIYFWCEKFYRCLLWRWDSESRKAFREFRILSILFSWIRVSEKWTQKTTRICDRLDHTREYIKIWRILSLWIPRYGKMRSRKTRSSRNPEGKYILGTILRKSSWQRRCPIITYSIILNTLIRWDPSLIFQILYRKRKFRIFTCIMVK